MTTRRAMLLIIALFLALRLGMSLLGVGVLWGGEPKSAFEGHVIFETHRLTVLDWGRAGQLLLDGWFRWDTGWYLKIATLGYSSTDGSIVFPPLYPLMIRLLAPLVGGHYLLAALIVSSVACLIMLLLFFEVARQELDGNIEGLGAVIYLAIFPTGFYLFAGYSESQFLALAFGAWLLALRERWIWAGVLAGLAALTRLQGWTLVFMLGWLVLAGNTFPEIKDPMRQVSIVISSLRLRAGWKPVFDRLKAGAWAVVVIPPIVFAGYMYGMQMLGYGSMRAAYDGIWKITVIPPWQGALLALQRTVQGSFSLTDWIEFGLFLFFVSLSVWGLFRLRPAFSLFVWANLGLILMRAQSIHPFTSFMRYIITLFPVFILMAVLSRRRTIRFSLVGIFLLLQVLLLWLFYQWYWVA